MRQNAGQTTDESRLGLLYQISREISSRLELAELLPRLLQRTLAGLPADAGSLMVLDEHLGLRDGVLIVAGQAQPDAATRLTASLAHGLPGRVVRNPELVYVPDLAADGHGPPDDSFGPGVRSAVVAPIMGRERVVGVLTVGRLPPESFSPDEQTLLTAIAAQAGIAVDNAALLAAERRGRAVSNTLREVARIINVTLDLDQVLPLVLEQLGRVITYDSASILLREGDRLRVSAARGFSDLQAVLQLTFDARRGVSARVVGEKRSLVLDDVQRSSEWMPAGVSETSRIRAWIGAPLIAKDEVMGLLAVDSWTPGAYTQADGQLVSAFAEQAAVAVLNARLFADSERRAYGLRALATTAQAINGTFDLSTVLRLVVQHARDWLGMEGASLALVEGDRLIFKEAVGPTADSLRSAALDLGQGIAGWVAANNQPLVVPDVRREPRFFKGIDESSGFRTRALACVPVRIGQRAIGVLEVVNPASGVFDPETLDLLDSLASLAGTAIVQTQRVAQIQSAENRFVGLFEDSLDPILITNLDGEITDANHSAVGFFGYPRDALLGLRVNHLHRVRTDSLAAGRFAPLLNGEPISYETRITTRAGAQVPVEVHAKLIERGDARFIYWVQHDLSDRLALEELREDLMSMIVHDLRSPLGNIISSLDILRSSLPGDDEMITSLLTIALRAASRLSRLVDSLLDLRRLEAGELGLQRLPVALEVLLMEAVEQVQPMVASKHLHLRTVVALDLPPAAADADLLRRVVVNLLDNAIKYTPQGGSITLGAKRSGSTLTVSLRDTGPGVPEGEHERIFNKFTRVQREAAPKGLGLGLAFCKLAIEAHGGRIWVDSERGGGATFSFTLPLAATAELRAAAANTLSG
jgi:PAS domain S-box-containing protein